MEVHFNREISIPRPLPITEAVIALNLHEARAFYAYLDSDERAPNMPHLMREIKDSLKPVIEEG